MRITEIRTEHRTDPLGIDSPHPEFSWLVEGDPLSHYQSAYQIQAAFSRKQLESGCPDLWDSGKVVSDRSFGILYEGAPLSDRTCYYWRVRVWNENDQPCGFSTVGSFETAFLSPDHFDAPWIGVPGDPSHGLRPGFSSEDIHIPMPEVVSTSLPMFRKTFRLLSETVLSARAYITGRGMFQLKINGLPAVGHFFEPGETDYRKEALYVTYDITSLLKEDGNLAEVTLGKGYYIEQPDGRYKKLLSYYGELMFKCRIEIRLADGSCQVIDSDDSWACALDGPITLSSWTGGEDHDARKHPRFTSHAQILPDPGVILKARSYPPLVVTEELPAVSVTPIDDHVILVDFGQNFAGMARFSLSAAPDTKIELWYSELLKDGRITQRTTGQPIWDSYIFRGDLVETWQPSFCYHGFRYMEVRIISGRVKDLSPEHFTGLKIRCDNEKTGFFETSNDAFNQIHRITQQSIEANMYNTCTDCPHREKLGWMEVPHLMWNSLAPSYDIQN